MQLVVTPIQAEQGKLHNTQLTPSRSEYPLAQLHKGEYYLKLEQKLFKQYSPL